MKRLKYLPLILILLSFMCCLILSLSDINLGDVHQIAEYGSHGISGGDPPPGGGHCSNVGVDFADNPFHGWPVNYRKGNWSTISSWFCDPNYFVGYTHWGIDIARLTFDESIYGVEAIVTAEDVLVVRATQNGRYNGGMGNNVQVEALTCELIKCNAEDQQDCKEWCLLHPGSCEEICTGTGWFAYYFHLKDVVVETGDQLEYGDIVGHVDSTGESTGDHLHYQLQGPEIGAFDPAPSMADDYDDSLRGTWQGR